MATEEKALDKIDIKSELKTLSPIEAKSLELKQRADEIEIIDKPSYQEAKRVKRELTSHRTATKELRLTFTRKLDNLKDQFIKKQDAVLEPSIAGEEVIKQKIAEWEKAERERKEAEEKRMQEILDRFAIEKLDRKTATLDDIRRVKAHIKAERSLLEPNDRNKVAVKNAVAAYHDYLDELAEFVNDRIEQERIAEEQRVEREKLQQERVKLHSEQLEAIGFPLNEVVFGFRISGLDLTKSDEEWQPIYEQAKKRLEMQKAKEEKPADEPVNTSYPGTASTHVSEPAKTSDEPVKTSEGSNPASVPSESLEPEAKSEDPNEKFWFVVTEEGIEGTGHKSPLDALVEYIELSDITGDRINEILAGKSEINHVEEYTMEELAALPEV